MIDLHCHILPGIDDGAPDLETSLQMARMAVADGITVTACHAAHDAGLLREHLGRRPRGGGRPAGRARQG
ncbi:MAG: hypothetical protein KL785_02880 [Brevundimonas sp.]|nr:hypothetical protein [Brevundimonas sp.]